MLLIICQLVLPGSDSLAEAEHLPSHATVPEQSRIWAV